MAFVEITPGRGQMHARGIESRKEFVILSKHRQGRKGVPAYCALNIWIGSDVAKAMRWVYTDRIKVEVDSENRKLRLSRTTATSGYKLCPTGKSADKVAGQLGRGNVRVSRAGAEVCDALIGADTQRLVCLPEIDGNFIVIDCKDGEAESLN